MLAISFISIPTISRPAHAFSCPLSSTNHKIEGCVVNGDTGSPVPSLYVYVIDCGGFQLTDYAITDSNGHFSFQTTLADGTPCINPNSAYVVSVNGVTQVTWADGCNVPNCNVLSKAADNPTWSQWAGDVSTDGNGYGSVVIQDSPARTVNVLASSLFSNTQFAAMAFSKTQGQTVSQTVGIQASIGGASNIQAGYQNSPSYTFSSANGFAVNPNVQAYYGIPSYVIGYYCAGSTSEQLYGWTCSQGLVNAGVTEATGAAYQITTTSENLNPNSAQVQGSSVTCAINVPAGTTQNFGYSGAGSTSSTFSISSTISLFGTGVTLSYSTSTSWQTEDATTVTISPTTGALNFRFYPASGPCNQLTFGPELHVWDMSADFSLSASPSSLSIAQGNSGTSMITVASLDFSGTVTLSAVQSPQTYSLIPCFHGNICTTVTDSTSVAIGSGGSISVTLTILVGCSSAPPGTYNVAVTGTFSSLSHTINIPVTVTAGSGCGGGGGASLAYGTLVTMADGNQVPVQSLKVGDQMLGYNTTTGRYQVSTVTSVVIKQATNMLVINTRTGTPLRVDASPTEVLWTKLTDGSTLWLAAPQLKVGDDLWTQNGWVPVTGINFAPAGNHTMWDVTATAPYFASGYLDPPHPS